MSVDVFRLKFPETAWKYGRQSGPSTAWLDRFAIQSLRSG